MTTQVAIRMNDQLLRDLDWIVIRCDFENRAEAVRAAIEAFAKVERDRAIDERIMAAYAAVPQTDDEVGWAGSRGFPGMPDEDWSEWL